MKFFSSKFLFFLLLIPFLIFPISHCTVAETDNRKELGFYALLYLSDYNNPDKPSVYFSTVRQVELEIAYETGAEPEAGNFALGGSPYWSVTEDNLKAIFADRDYTVNVVIPTSSSEMKNIPKQNRSTWTVSQILDLASRYQSRRSDFQTARFFLVYVNGHLDNNGSPNTSVVGVNIGGTPVTVVFKDVVKDFAANMRPIAEQVTVVHELGHALGFVNNGIPLTSQHQDIPNGKHCTNTTCAMYHQIEGKTSLNNFAQSYFSTMSRVVIKSECLEDAKKYKP
ncbi:hypothetical protein [Leptospira idonii]|uniref:Uncharacterized protein n=1 Tax=Leptospira idonii TaxID=1193500 RepID=A0A4R9M0R4_9LEPT|nr:hypothetical protein [Leptospira idonii]TGN19632.1 hypothetical protein EHS15_07560 [Leptospira idonii]